jgi:ferritin-like protein
MAQSAGLHEPEERLSPATIDRHRAYVSVQEELDAADWYDQRVQATTDRDLTASLAHNRDEEKEHASMVLEWLRRHDPMFARHLRTFLFTTEPITEIESDVEGAASGAEAAPSPDATGAPGPHATGSLGIGGLKGEQR